MRFERLQRSRLSLWPVAALVALPLLGSAALASGLDSAAIAPPPSPSRLEPPKPTAADAPEKSDKPAEDLPSVDTLLANYIKAIGSEERLRKNTSRRVTGRFEMSAMPGMAAPMTINSMAPNLMVLSIELPGMGEMKQGFDGEHGWSLDPMQGPMLMPEEQLRQFRREADFFKDLNFKEQFKKIEVVGRGSFEGRDTFKVTMTAEDDDTATAHFGVEDHLLWGIEMIARSPMGEMPSRSIIKEYGEFDGVKVATRTEMHVAGMVQTLIVEKLEFDVLEKSHFELPPPVRTLVDAKKAREKPELPKSP